MKLNIIQVTHGYPPSLGGVQHVTKELSENLATKGHNVSVFTPALSSRGVVLQNNLTINYLKSYEIAHTNIIFSLFPKLLRIPKNSIIHLHIARAYISEIVYLVSKTKKIPYVAHYHIDVGPSGKFAFLLPVYKKFILKKILHSASRVVVLSEEYKKFVEDKYMLKNVVVVPNGVSKRFFVNRNIRKSNYVNILFVGSLSSQKNIPVLIKTMNYVKTNAKLHIVGDGELMQTAKSMVKENNLTNVQLPGKKVDSKLLEYYKNADIFFIASKIEGMPLVVLEAMAAGLPIIASDVKGNREILKRVGKLVHSPTPKKFAKAIDELILNPDKRTEMAKAGRRKAKRYSWDNVANSFEGIYKEVLNENK